MKVGETSSLVTGLKASYLLRLVAREDPSPEEFEKERAGFQTQFLAMKRELVLGDWLREVRKSVPVRLETEGL